jgi:flagellar biosynthesis protein FlhG
VKPLLEQDHYEILEVRRGAAPEEIERAYRLALATYAEDSLAGYSVFEEGDAAAIRENIELAYRTLADPTARKSYDTALSRSKAATARGGAELPTGSAGFSAPEPQPEALDALDEADEDSGDFDGSRLRRARLRQGVELDEIAGVTKVNPVYLSFIEEERFDDLPAAVYVRGFVMGYASCVGLDAARVSRSYMKRYEESRGERKRSLFSRR